MLSSGISMAVEIDAIAITTHPGLIHRLEDRVRDMGMKMAIETLSEAARCADDSGVILSVENMGPGTTAPDNPTAKDVAAKRMTSIK